MGKVWTEYFTNNFLQQIKYKYKIDGRLKNAKKFDILVSVGSVADDLFFEETGGGVISKQTQNVST